MHRQSYFKVNASLITLVAISAIFPFGAFAGTRDSGGGNARVCFNHEATAQKVRAQGRIVADEDLPDVREVTFLDIYDSEVLHPIGTVIAPNSGESMFDYYNRIAQRFDTISSVGADLQAFKSSLPDTKFVFTKLPLNRIFDLSEVISYENDPSCVVVTMAAQDYDEDSNTTLVTIDSRLLNLADPASQAVVALHERLYYIFRFVGETNSENTRYLVRLLISRNSWTADQWVQTASRFFSDETNEDPSIFTTAWWTPDQFAPLNEIEETCHDIGNALEVMVGDAQATLAFSDSLIKQNLTSVPDMSPAQSAKVTGIMETGIQKAVGIADFNTRAGVFNAACTSALSAAPQDGPVDQIQFNQ